MSSIHEEKHANGYGTYGFRFQDALPNDVANIFTIGREEKISGIIYDWHGLKRREVGTYVFQYTLSGSGRLDIGGNSYPLEAGEAFIIEVPSDHRYYFPGGVCQCKLFQQSIP